VASMYLVDVAVSRLGVPFKGLVPRIFYCKHPSEAAK
jgi:hypothetical protein